MKRHMLFTAAAMLLTGTAIAQDNRAISNVTGDVYRFQNNFHFSLVVVTDEGTVVIDPINAGASGWLKDNLSEITDQPVTYLIYSHSHGDHASGGTTYDGATVIAQANAPADIDGAVPDIRFDDTHVLEVGGKTIELTYLGPGHGDDMIAAVVRPENVAFIVDIAAPKRMPYQTLPSSSVDAWIEQIEAAEQLDFDIFAPGHGRVGTPDELTEARVYMEELREQVLNGLNAGKSVDQLKAEIKMDDYAGWQQYEAWFPLNIEGMANYLTSSGIAQ